MPPLSFEHSERRLWHFKDADWRSIERRLLAQDWSWIDNSTPNIVVACLTQMMLCFMDIYIPSSQVASVVSHPWINQHCLDAVQAKRLAAGTDSFPAAVAACSSAMLEAFKAHTQRTRQKLRTLGRGSKKWWKISNELLSHIHKSSSFPLKRPDGSWAVCVW